MGGIKIKLIYKGNFKGEEYLTKADLPSNSVKFIEPETAEELSKTSMIFLIPCAILIGIIVFMSINHHNQFNYDNKYFFLSLLLSFATILPHEILHEICFGKDAEVELYVSLKNMMAFVVSTKPISKRRFIFLSLLPNIVFGWIPLLIWAFMPYNAVVSNILLPFSIICISFGVGDYLNVWNAMRQMPKNSMQVLSGFNSYWYIEN